MFMAYYFICLGKIELEFHSYSCNVPTLEFHSYSCNEAEMDKEGVLGPYPKVFIIGTYQKVSLVR